MSDTDEPIYVTMQDLRELGYCSRGSHAFLTARGINWMEFLQHGVAVDVLEQFDDEMVRTAIARARARIAAGET